MKTKDKIINFFKENYKLIIPILLLLVIFIAFIIYYKVSILDNYREYKDEKVYQYFFNQKYEYKASIGFNRKQEVVEFKTKDYDINFDSTPIYYQKQNKVIFPSNMSVVMPTLNCSEYLLAKYSLLQKNKGNYILKTEDYEGKLGHYFLYDGNNLYFFLDEVTLTIGDDTIKLSPLSYVIADTEKSSISYYDKENDTAKTIETLNTDSVVETEYYKIYISIDQIDYYGEDVILTSKIDELNPIKMKENN